MEWCFSQYIYYLSECSLLSIATTQMPQGSECNPHHAWWQGSVMYEVFVPSFHDSNGDGVGDLPGLTAKLDYVQVC